MTELDYVLVGGGLASASAVDGLRETDEGASAVLLTDEDEPPYHRPPLSKEYMQNAEVPRRLLHVKPEGWFREEAGVELLTGTRAVSLDPAERRVVTDGGRELRARSGVLLATGGRPRRLPVPGGDMEGVLVLRSVVDAEEIRHRAVGAERVALVGAGFIGMELAASLRDHDVDPVVVETRDRVWPGLLPDPLAAWVRNHFEERGVAFELGRRVEAFRGRNAVESLELDSGEAVACDFAVVGVGIDPDDELARDAGLTVGDGIVVDRYGETSVPGVYAAGDVASFPDPVSGERRRVEHWDHAKAHGRAVGRNMGGARDPYDHVSYFFSDVFDLSFNVLGDPAGAERLVLRGEIGEPPFVAFGVVGDDVTSSLLVNAREDLDPCRSIVRARPPALRVAEALSDPDVDLDEIASGLAGE